MRWIGIVGSRDRNNRNDKKLLLETFWKHYMKEDHIVSGGCEEGADAWAEELAKNYQIPILIYYPPTLELGDQGYAYRNNLIATTADIVIGLPSKMRGSGAAQTVRMAELKGKVVFSV